MAAMRGTKRTRREDIIRNGESRMVMCIITAFGYVFLGKIDIFSCLRRGKRGFLVVS